MSSRIYLNRLKYGDTFTTALRLIQTTNPYGVSDGSGGSSEYVDLCEAFFDGLHRELKYHNYVMMLTPNDYEKLVSNCLDKAIFLKDRDQYKVQLRDLDHLSQQLQPIMSAYLTNVINQTKLSLIEQLSRVANVKIINHDDLEQNFIKTRGRYLLENRKIVLKRPLLLPAKCTLLSRKLPMARMELNYPKVPQIDSKGRPIFQTNLLDQLSHS